MKWLAATSSHLCVGFTPWTPPPPLAQPGIEPRFLPAVDDAVRGDPGDPRLGDGVVGERELRDAVGVAVEREDAARVHRDRRQLVVDVLTMPVAVDLDGDVTP